MTATKPPSVTRSGYSLLVSSWISAALGLAYWFAVARLYDADALGRATAAVSAMLLLASIGTGGLKRGLIRFVPAFGPKVGRFVAQIYAVGTSLSVGLAVVFVIGVGGWSDDLGLLHGSLSGPVLFLAVVAIWSIFVLQDPVLIGSGASGLVPFENAVFSALKIVVVLVGASVFGAETGVLISWGAPALLTAAVVNWWLYRVRFPERARRHSPPSVGLGDVARFAGGEYLAALVWIGAVYLTPLIVIASAGAAQNAYFFLAFQIAYAVFLVSSNICDALVAHAAEDPGGLRELVTHVSKHLALLVVPAVLAIVIAAPWIMALFGEDYRDAATGVLRLLVLAAIPNTVTTVMVALAHIRRLIWVVVVIQLVMAIATLGLVVPLVERSGIIGVAWAWLIAQCISMVLAVALTVWTESANRPSVEPTTSAASPG